MASSLKRLELLIWAITPALITLFLTIVCLVPKHISGLNSFMPMLPLIPIFYWGMMHAREMPYWFVFLIGLIMDIATGMPLGLSSLLNILFLGLLRTQRKFINKEGFIIKWGYFSMLLLVMVCLNWLLVSLLNSRAEVMMPAFIQWLLTIGCYPLLHSGFDWLYQHIHNRKWQLLHRH